MTARRNQSGVTLLELLITLAILSIIAAFAVPSLNSLVTRSAHQSNQMDLLGIINLARTTAIMESTNVTLCPLDENGKCSKDWSLDLVAFRDPKRARQLVDSSQVIRVLQTKNNGKLKGNAGIRSYFGFRPSGAAREAIGNIIWCPNSNDPRDAFQIRINMGGRPMVARDTNEHEIVKGADGRAISCS